MGTLLRAALLMLGAMVIVACAYIFFVRPGHMLSSYLLGYDLDPASLRTVRERLPGGGALGDGPDGLALARRRTTLLRSLCDAGRLTEAESGLL